eukprot:CAMPEP_0172677232 /NCGR_PEP_ID=MMETSP1074-20121228/14540_1 /TAXON_ID=2916 /ORGANISM="Ceratium fusus, Strain PA161109" /LENGTH=123 /DNA_ID=CAMNT_0013495039 /DNA_START=69 /DNA_END=443 /DNA_ORIENTATION=+
MAQLSDTDQFMVMLNVCAAVCGGFIYWLLTVRQRQLAGQRERYCPGLYVSLAEASQAWKVYKQCGSKTDRDTHVCNFCGFTIKAAPTEFPGSSSQELAQSEDGKSDGGKSLKKRVGKKGKKAS